MKKLQHSTRAKSHSRRIPLGKALVSGVLVLAMSTMSWPTSVAAAISSSASSSSAAVESSSAVEPQTSSPSSSSASVDAAPAANAGAEQATQAPQAPQATAEPEAASAKTLERTIASESGTYTVKVKYDDTAAIPQGAELTVLEYTQEPSDPNWRDDPAYAARPYNTEQFVSAEYLTQRSSVVAKGLGAQDTDYVFFTKLLDVAIIKDGQSIQPQADVQVSIETNAVDISCSDAMTLAKIFFDEKTANDPESAKNGFLTSDGKTAASLNASILTYEQDTETGRKPADDKIVKLQYSTKEFGEIALAGVAVPKATLLQTDAGTVQVFGAASQNVSTYEANAAGLPEGEELLGAYTFGIDPAREHGAMLWARSVNAGTQGSAIAAHQLQDGMITGEATMLGSAGSALAFKAEDGVAIVNKNVAPAIVNDASAANAPASGDAVNTPALEQPEATVDDASVLQTQLASASGGTYTVKVSRSEQSGIPEGATLQVSELSGFELQKHRLQTMKALGTSQMTAMRFLDIKILDENGNEIQPSERVDVSITLDNAPVSDDSQIVHFGGVGTEIITPEQSTAPVSEGATTGTCTLEFSAASFSVYALVFGDGGVVTGPPRVTFVFYVWNASTGVYSEYMLTTDSGASTATQTIKSGEKPFVPQLASSDGQAFAGWYEGSYESGSFVLANSPYDFDNIEVTENAQVNLYAVYADYSYVVFHDQYDSSSHTYPVAHTRRAELVGAEGSKTGTVKISDLSTTYNSSDGDANMAFFGWSRTPVQTPNSPTDDNGNPVSVITPDEDGCITVNSSEPVHLYPVYKPVNWLTYFSGPTNSGATYVPPAYYFSDEGPMTLKVPTMAGSTFQGWYTGVMSGDTINYGVQVTDADGNLIPGVEDGNVRVSQNHLLLKGNATLYAKWEANTTADYRIVTWKQKTTDATGLDDANKSYEYAESDTLTGGVGSSISVPDQYKQRGYSGYEYARCDDAKAVTSDGSMVLNVYYDLDGSYAISGQAHTLSFVDSVTGDGASGSLPVTVSGVTYQASLSGHVPSDPVSGRTGYTFTGWYMDPDCTIKANLDSATMPDHDLTVYAGWEKEWFLVQIDPNYGALYSLSDDELVGTGATWFWEDYGGDPIQEYTHARRDYVESGSGTWFYVKQDYNGYYSGNPPTDASRKTYYTQNPDEATDYTTFEYAPNTYSYAGWYEVMADGSEVPYDFDQQVDHNTTLKLHWKKAGSYYISYDAGEGTLDTSGQDETTYQSFDDASYADRSDVVVTRSATAPDGYRFAGWRVRGDNSGPVYGPGQIFTLHAEDAVRASGKDTVYLDAVYVRVGTASITYNVNGGVLDSSAIDYGSPGGVDSVGLDGETATVSNLVNNSNFTLSNGTGFTRAGYTLLGWSNKQVYNPNDPEAELYTLGGTYGVDTAEPTTLYAVWGATVTYHLNDGSASWNSSEWPAATYTHDSAQDTYTQTVPLGTPVTEPAGIPANEGKIFQHWSADATAGSSAYDFSSTVETNLDLYAQWDTSVTVSSHAVDASTQNPVVEDSWFTGSAPSFTVSTSNTSANEVLLTEPASISTPSGYQYEFATVGTDAASITKADKATALYYDTATKKVYVDYANKADAPLGAGESVYFLYHGTQATPEDTRNVDVHVALVDNNGIVLRDDLRKNTALFSLEKGESASLPSDLPSENVFQGDTSVYALGAVLCGTSAGSNYSPIDVASMDVATVSYVETELAYGGKIYEPLLKNAAGETVGNLDNNQVYYLYYPMAKIKYVKQEANGDLTPIQGSTDGTVAVSDITYGGSTLNMNGVQVAQNQAFQMPLNGFVISQDGRASSFGMPPVLDDGISPRYLAYTRIGAGNADVTNISSLGGNVSDRLSMRLQVQNNTLMCSFDNGASWQPLPLSGTPTVYAIYTERGYDLQISKTVNDSGIEDGFMFSDASFTVTVKSMAITRSSYAAEGAQEATVQAVPASGSTPGSITLAVNDGSQIRLKGMPRGEYTIEETDNTNFNLTARAGSIVGGSTSPVSVEGNSTISLSLDAEKRIDLTNTPKPICKIGSEVFYTLSSAMNYVYNNVSSRKATVEMLTDYVVPAEDTAEVFGGCEVTLTTATVGFDGAGSMAVITRSSDMTEAPLLTNSGILKLEYVLLEGSGVEASKPMVQSSGDLTLGAGAVVRNAVNTGNGGAVNATAGVITVSGNITNCRAANGGAIYHSGTGGINLSGTGAINNNTATSGDGGAIYATSGVVSLLGTSEMTGNRAQAGHGGAIYAANASVSLGENGELTNNTAQEGGAVYNAHGTVSVSATEGVTPPSVTGNRATAGDGGAIWAGAGSVTISGGTFTENVASATGKGGVVYANSASVNVSGGTMSENSAVNGAAVFANSGNSYFSGGSITANTASNGGAVGIGSDSSRLNFSGSIEITGNIMAGSASNVYLDQDSDMVINANGLAVGASVGIYVPGSSSLFTNRGDIGGRFGSYVTDANVDRFSNDRMPSLVVMKDTTRKKLYWSMPIAVEARYLASFGDVLPPAAHGDTKWSSSSYAPVSSDAAISTLADDIRANNNLGLSGEATYSVAFAGEAATFGDYLTRLIWDNDTGIWMVEKRDGTREALGNRTLIIYYSLPAYVSIENNTNYDLDLNSLYITVGGQQRSLINNASTIGYSLVFAKNGAIQSALQPFAGDGSGVAQLESGESVTLLVPGGRNQNYALAGSFVGGGTENIRLRRTGVTEESVRANEPISFTGKTLNNNNTYQIIFGDDKPICKIVDSYGENVFTTIAAALTYAKNHITDPSDNLNGRVKIEMLVDYLMPGNDVLEVTNADFAGLDYLELTTATSGTYKYNGECATISRATDNRTKPLVSIIRGATAPTEVYVHDINFDGKSVSGNVDGGAIKTGYCKTTVQNVEFANCIANNGGALFVSYGTQSGQNFPIDSSFDYDMAIATITNCSFTNCRSQVTSGDRMGGGAIWTNARTLELSGTDFESCSAGLQAGAVFHRIDTECTGYTPTPRNDYADVSMTHVTDCTFTDCVASKNAGGGMESDAWNVTMEGCEFTNCVATNSHGGGFNTYIYQKPTGSAESWGSEFPTFVTVRDCTFISCTAGKDGGGFHSASNTTLVENCSFENCNANQHGGALGVNNGNNGEVRSADAATIRGVTIRNCAAAKRAGAIVATVKVLTIEDYTPASGEAVHTEISNCTAGTDGGAIYHNRQKETDGETNIIGVTISNCTAETGYGGGIYTWSYKTSVRDTVIQNCVCKGTQWQNDGGGAINAREDTAGSQTILDGCTFTGNKAATKGGGVVVYNSQKLTILNNTTISGNTVPTAGNAAGLYLHDRATLEMGSDELREAGLAEGSTIANNTTENGVVSNLRLPEASNVNSNSVVVHCDLNGYIGVVNAKRAGTQFGTSPNSTSDWRPSGLSDTDAVFNSDSDTLKGIIDRMDTAGVKVIWAGPPICKLTDADGNMLYFKADGSDPAIFDRLNDTNNNVSRTAAFNYLRNGTRQLYLKDGTPYTTNSYCIKMLVENYTMQNAGSIAPASAMTVVFTTAGTADAEYPYTGRAGSYSTVKRGTSMNSGSNTIEFSTNNAIDFTFKNITLDGNRKTESNPDGVTASAKTRLLNLVNSNSTFTVRLGENAVLQNAENVNDDGAAVYIYRAYFVMEGGTIRNCKSGRRGGAICDEGNGLNKGGFEFKAGTIVDCEAGQTGGAVHVFKTSLFTMSGGTIARCSAPQGGGVYIDNGSRLDMSGGNIINNTATTQGGGIAVGGTNSRINFSGRVTVTGNTRTSSLAPDNACNIELNYDSNNIINTNNGGLLNGARIGVYVPDGANYYTKHGEEGDPFGTFADGDNTTTLYGFVNDRNGLKGGVTEGQGSSDKKIYWIRIFSLEVSKNVETSENIPSGTIDNAKNEEFTFKVTLTGHSTIKDLSAQQIEGEFGEMNFISNGVDATTATFKLKSGESMTAENLDPGFTYEIVEVVSSDQANKYLTLPGVTQSGTIGENSSAAEEAERYISRRPFTNILPVCKITDNSGNILYKNVDGIDHHVPAIYTELADAFAALDGTLYSGEASSAPSYASSNGCHVEMITPDYSMPTPITVADGKSVVFTTASKTAAKFPYQGTGSSASVRRGNGSYGNFSMLHAAGSLTLDTIILDGSKNAYPAESAYGGIVSVPSGGNLAIQTGAVLQNSRALAGGAVFIVPGGTVTMSGGAVRGNESVGDGAGIYVSDGATLNLSGNPNFGGPGTNAYGDLDPYAGNFSSMSFVAKTNGGKAYTKARQDIFIAGYTDTPAASLIVNGRLTADDGTIWVWAAENPHFVQGEQFAMRSTSDVGNLQAFRNAQDDQATGNTTDSYLYGMAGDGNNIIWSGVAVYQKVILQKVDANYASFANANFTLYRGMSTGSSIVRDRAGNELSGITSASNGVIFVGEIPEGTFYLHETAPQDRWFVVTISAEGATCAKVS